MTRLTGSVSLRYDQGLKPGLEGMLLTAVLRLWKETVDIGLAETAKTFNNSFTILF